MSADTSHDSEDFSEIEMDELDSYLTSPPVSPADPPRSRDARASRPPVLLASSEEFASARRVHARRFKSSLSVLASVEADRERASISAPSLPRDERRRWSTTTTMTARAPPRARLAARAAHGEGGMAAQAAAEAAVEAVATGDANALSSLDANALSSLHARTPGATCPKSKSSRAFSNAEGAQKRKHIISPPMKVHRRKNDSGAPGVNVARAARDLCGDLGEPKESLMRRAVDVIGVVAANDLAIEVGAIEGAGGQMTTDGTRRRTPGGVFWAPQGARRQGGLGLHLRGGEGGGARALRRRRRAQSATARRRHALGRRP